MGLDISYPLAVIGIDPGGTTGIAVYGVPGADRLPVQLETHQWGDRDTVVDQLIELCKTLPTMLPIESIVIAAERFDKRPGVIDPDYSSMFIENEMRRRMKDTKIVWQTPSQAKNLVKPGRTGVPDGLKRFGWYNPGNRHANDASRHAIVFLVERLNHMPTILRGWPQS